MSYLNETERKLMFASVMGQKIKTQAELNNELLLELSKTIDKLNDRINDIELNVKYIHNAIKAQENRSDSSNNGWFIF
jgi:hypothetical protein